MNAVKFVPDKLFEIIVNLIYIRKLAVVGKRNSPLCF